MPSPQRIDLNTDTLSCAAWIAKFLQARGVDRIFGNPGTTESPLLDSLLDYPQIQYIVHLHEGVATGAANFYAQASGKTAFVNLHVAPGLGNAIGAINVGARLGVVGTPVPVQRTAEFSNALRDGLISYDRRHGWRARRCWRRAL